MAASNLTPWERRRLDCVLRTLTEPAVEMLLDRRPDTAGGMRPATVQSGVVPLVGAAVELHAGCIQPTDAAFEEYGGPGPASVGRLLRGTDLSDLPCTHLRRAMDEQFVAPPERIVVEAWTEPTKGPGKFGGVHVNPPPGMETLVVARPIGAANTTGGIASVFALAECGALVHPCGEVPIQQPPWTPESWPTHDRKSIERMLRHAGGFHGSACEFVRTPEEVAARLMARLTSVDQLCAWDVRFDGLVIVGGCLRLGFPDTTATLYGGGRHSRYIGGTLAALREIRDNGHVGFFELPQRARSTGRRAATEGAAPDWSLRAGNDVLTMAAAEELVYGSDSPWKPVDSAVVERVAEPGSRAWRLAATAFNSAGEVPVQLIFMTDHTGRTDLYVSTAAVVRGDAAAEEQLVRLAAEESGRRRPGSKLEVAVRELLHDGWALRNQRRRYPDRRGLAAVAQTAFGVLQIVRHGAC